MGDVELIKKICLGREGVSGSCCYITSGGSERERWGAEGGYVHTGAGVGIDGRGGIRYYWGFLHVY